MKNKENQNVFFLNLEKQEIVKLTSAETSNVTGGGKGRSDRRTGNCHFSRKYGVTYSDCGGTSDPVPIGCLPKC